MRYLTILLLASCAQVGGGDTGAGNPSTDDACVPPTAPITTCGRVQIEDRDIEINSCADYAAAQLPDGCWKLTGTLTISGEAVTSVARLGGLQHVNGLILDDTGLSSFDTDAPVTVGGGLILTNNPELADIANLKFEDELDGVKLDKNPKLETIGAVANVDTFTGEAVFTNNRRLAKLDLAARSVGSLAITDDELLSEIALPNLTAIGSGTGLGRVGDFDGERLPALGSLALAHLKTIAGNLTLVDTGLTSLATFGTGLVVDWDLTITDNTGLADLGALSHAHQIMGTIDISNNQALACQAAHEVGCCVQADGFTADGNATASCTTDGSPWCKQGSWTYQCFH